MGGHSCPPLLRLTGSHSSARSRSNSQLRQLLPLSRGKRCPFASRASRQSRNGTRNLRKTLHHARRTGAYANWNSACFIIARFSRKLRASERKSDRAAEFRRTLPHILLSRYLNVDFRNFKQQLQSIPARSLNQPLPTANPATQSGPYIRQSDGCAIRISPACSKPFRSPQAQPRRPLHRRRPPPPIP